MVAPMSDPSADPANWNRQLSEATEIAGLEVLREYWPRVEEAFARVNDGGYMHAEPRSTLRLDDRYLGVWSEGALHQVALNAAIDGLLTVKTLIQDAESVPMTALYPVLRASIENASLALSMIEPTDRDDRLLASFRAMADDAKRLRQFGVSTGVADAQQRYDDAMARIDALLAARANLAGLAARDLTLPSYTELVAAADARLAADPAHDRSHQWTLSALWKLLSGLSHGRAWAMLIALERSGAVVDPTPRPGVSEPVTRSGSVIQTTSVAFVAVLVVQALELIESVIRLYGQRSRNNTALSADADEQWS